MCSRDEEYATRHCNQCGGTYHGKLGHVGCPRWRPCLVCKDWYDPGEKNESHDCKGAKKPRPTPPKACRYHPKEKAVSGELCQKCVDQPF